MRMEILVPTSNILGHAAEFAFKHNITLYDSYYLALAKEIGALFVTADEKLYKAVKDDESMVLLGSL